MQNISGVVPESAVDELDSTLTSALPGTLCDLLPVTDPRMRIASAGGDGESTLHVAAGKSFTIDGGFSDVFLDKVNALRQTLPFAQVWRLYHQVVTYTLSVLLIRLWWWIPCVRKSKSRPIRYGDITVMSLDLCPPTFGRC